MKTYKVKQESSEKFMKEHSAENVGKCTGSVDDYQLIKKDGCDFDILLMSIDRHCGGLKIEMVYTYERQEYDDYAYKFVYTRMEYYFEDRLLKTINK